TVFAAKGEQSGSENRNGSQVDTGGVIREEAEHTGAGAGCVSHVRLEIAPPSIDQVITDVGGPVGGRGGGGGLARAFDRSQSYPDLRFGAGLREVLDRLTLPVSTEEVHPSVRVGWISS